MWIAKKKFLDYEKGAEVKEEDAKKYGSLYCTESNDAASNVTETKESKKNKKK